MSLILSLPGLTRQSRLWFAAIALCAIPAAARAHVSERALVLILPTDVYVTAGVVAVVVTVALTLLVPAARFMAIATYGPEPVDGAPGGKGRIAASCASAALLLGLIALGIAGPRDPLENLLPLVLLTLWWICFPVVQALFGDLWAWINPWTGPLALLARGRHPLRLPEVLGVWPAVATYFLAGVFALTDIAPDDPDRLAMIAGGYWLFTLVMGLLFGESWLRRGEGFTVFFGLIARISPLSWRATGRLGGLKFPGKAIVEAPAVQTSVAIFSVSLLAIGSFDGLNETFWWMARLGINPLEFPGRSAVVWQNRIGLVGAVVLLNLAFALCVWTGLRLVGRHGDFWPLWRKLALTILPIALGYHFAHYLTSALVNLQYLLAALNDPMETGAALLGLHHFHVTTSFFNQWHTVRAIWLTQAGSIVLAHMLAIVLSHAIALRAFGSHRTATLSQAPVAGFMVLYTWFGLWLLASPLAL